MSNNLVTLQQATKQRFNMERRRIESLQDFMRFYLMILEQAFQFKLLSEEGRNNIASAILSAVNMSSNYEPVIVSNYVYVISMRLQDMTNFEAWETMSKISNLETAKDFVQETKSWFQTLSKTISSLAKKGTANVIGLKEINIIRDYKILLRLASELEGCLTPGNKNCNLKALHNNHCIPNIEYELISSFDRTTYPTMLKNAITDFQTEIGILLKANSYGIIKQLHEERSRIFATTRSHNEEMLYKAEHHLRALEQEYQKKFSEAHKTELEENEFMMQLMEKFESQHPEMDEDERDDAFYTYYYKVARKTSPFKDAISTEDLRKEYEKKRRKSISEVTKWEYLLDSEVESRINAQGELRDEPITLLRVLKEYALFSLCTSGKMHYPHSPEEKGMILLNIPFAMVQQESVKLADTLRLTSKEKDYLLGNLIPRD